MNSVSLPTILVGPIIGKVTENSARILIEFDRKVEITVQIYDYSITKIRDWNSKVKIKPNFQETKLCEEEIPQILSFRGLKGNTKYLVFLKNPHCFKNPELEEIETSFTTTSSYENAKKYSELLFLVAIQINFVKRLSQMNFAFGKHCQKKLLLE